MIAMALTLLQRIRVFLRGWSRRREEDAKRRQEEFLARNVSWGRPAPGPSGHPLPRAGEGTARPDLEGLQVAYLDDSGRIAYFLEVQTGEVVERRDGGAMPAERYKPVPRRSAESDAEDRRAFVATLEDSRMRQSLSMTLEPHDFRRLLAHDRALERAWYNFKNERASQAIEQWLRGLEGERPSRPQSPGVPPGDRT